MESNNIDRTHIVALKEVNGTLQYVEKPIEKPEQLIAELKAMVDNPNRTVWDMQSLFIRRFSAESGYHDFLFPYSYRSSYVPGVLYPAKYKYEQLKKTWEDAAKSAEESYKEECKQYHSAPTASEITRKREEAITSIKSQQKRSLCEEAIRWIDASCYNREAVRMHRDSSIKMYSKENIGWNTFSYKINKDIEVEVRTNFGYGSAAYFFMGVKYKGMAILPYSYIVRYYKANMTDIVRCTRSYEPARESWCAAFDFISDFANKAAADPEKFVKTYIMDEVEEMMAGLEAISVNSRSYMQEIQWRRADKCVINVMPMFDGDRKRMASYPDEAPVLFKVEKIMGAMKFLDSLNEIAKEVNTVRPHIDRLYELNYALGPEIEDAVAKIEVKIAEHTNHKALLDKQISFLTEKLKPFEDEILELRSKLSNPYLYDESEYEKNHKDYKELKNEKNERQTEANKEACLINDLKSFVTYLNNSLSQLNKVKEAA